MSEDGFTFSDAILECHMKYSTTRQLFTQYLDAHSFAMTLVLKLLESSRTATSGPHQRKAHKEVPKEFTESNIDMARKILQGPPFKLQVWTEDGPYIDKNENPALLMGVECYSEGDQKPTTPIIKDF